MNAKNVQILSDRSDTAARVIGNPRRGVVTPAIWWRTRAPQTVSRNDIRTVRASLLKTKLPHEADWLYAITGDPAIAIGVAVRQLNAYGMLCPLVDIAMAAVHCCAIEGNAAARAVVESALRRRRRFDPFCDELLLQWRAASF